MKWASIWLIEWFSPLHWLLYGQVINQSNGQKSARLTEYHEASRPLGTSLKVPYRLEKKKLMGFSIKYRFIIFLSMTFIEFVTLHSNLLLCWHGFRDVTVNVGICWQRQSCFCGCLVNLTICNTTYHWPTNHSPPNIIHDQLLIWTTKNQFIWLSLNLTKPQSGWASFWLSLILTELHSKPVAGRGIFLQCSLFIEKRFPFYWVFLYLP